MRSVWVIATLLTAMTGCGGSPGAYETPSGKLCLPISVPIVEMRRECHAGGNDGCAYITTEQYSYAAVGYDCK